jgi:hypothetical protein
MNTPLGGRSFSFEEEPAASRQPSYGFNDLHGDKVPETGHGRRERPKLNQRISSSILAENVFAAPIPPMGMAVSSSPDVFYASG